MSPTRYRLLDIQRAIQTIEGFVVGGEADFRGSILIQHGVFHNLTVIGEAARAIPAGVRGRFSQVPWPRIIGLRNVITHEYHRLKLDVIWGVVRDDLPKLKKDIETILPEYPE